MNKEILLKSHINYTHIILLFSMFHFFIGLICHTIISVIINIPFTFEDIFYLNNYSYIIYELIVCLILFTVLNVKLVSHKMQNTKNKLYMTTLGISIGLCLLLIQSYLNNIVPPMFIYSCLIGVFLYLSFIILQLFMRL